MVQLSRTSVKSVFVFFLIYLPLQFLWIGIAGVVWSEPWPAFALPGFKNIYIKNGYCQIQKPFFYAAAEGNTGKTIEFEVSEFELLEGMQPSQVQGFLRTHFSEPGKYSTKGKQWLEHQLEQAYPKIKTERLKVVWKQITYQHVEDSLIVHSKKENKKLTISFDD